MGRQCFFRNERWQAGLSLSDWPAHDVDIQNSVFGLNTQLSAFFQWQYDFSQNIQFQPNLVMRTDFVSTQTEINALMRINGNIFGGVMLRGYSSSSLDALGFSIGHKINRRYAVFYNYDAGISALKRSNEGSHELILKVNFYNLPATGIPPKIIYNPRFLE
ncbi:MAG: type IX secretion system membrane protein PorP/SprF [Saprospiraceae bacterium]|nr:type IX secretion system membrane protein PorP/SprF [Saprospiraceae bacterium]